MAAAGGLEAAICRGDAGLDEPLTALDTQLTVLIAAGTAWREVTQAAPVAAAAPPLEPTLLDALRAALDGRDLQVLHDIEALQPALRSTLGEEGTERLTNAIHGLRFEEARALLDQHTRRRSQGFQP